MSLTTAELNRIAARACADAVVKQMGSAPLSRMQGLMYDLAISIQKQGLKPEQADVLAMGTMLRILELRPGGRVLK